jgi:hypothetical protein
MQGNLKCRVTLVFSDWSPINPSWPSMATSNGSRPVYGGRPYPHRAAVGPKAVVEHIGMLARKQPFAACGNLTPGA